MNHTYLLSVVVFYIFQTVFTIYNRVENRTWYLSLEDGGWNSTLGPDMIMSRWKHSCSSFIFLNELILVVVGGVSNSGFNFNEFLSYESEDSQWDNRDTELDLPSDYDYSGQILVSNGETLFYINTLENVFFRLEYTGFEDGFQWIPMNLNLETPRQFAVGILIPDELANCSKTIEIKDSD